MKRGRFFLPTLVSTIALTVLAALYLWPSSHSADDGVCDSWTIEQNPDFGLFTSNTKLLDVYSISEDNAWSVGTQRSVFGQSTQPLIIHWNGKKWHTSSTPNVNSADAILRSVTAHNESDVWAVGYYLDASRKYRTLTMHWDGERWSLVQSPSLGGDSFLYSVASVSENDAWAVGSYSSPGRPDQPLTLHWNGSTWTAVTAVESELYSGYLEDVSALSDDNVWVVGSRRTVSETQTLAQRWDGKQWHEVNTFTSVHDQGFLGISVLSEKDLWAVGSTSETGGLIARWSHETESFAQIQSKHPVAELYAIDGTSRDSIWAVGSGNTPGRLVLLHWNGLAWATNTVDVGSSSGQEQEQALYGISVHEEPWWAVGSSGNQALILRNIPCSTITKIDQQFSNRAEVSWAS